MSPLSSAVKRHPLITFFVVTFALSWTFEIPLVVLHRMASLGPRAWSSTSSRPTSLQC